MKKNNWVTPALIAIGLILILFSTWSPNESFKFGFSKKNMASIVEILGTVKVQNNELPIAVTAKLKQEIEINSVILTDSNSEALIEFKTGGQFRVSEKSEILIDKLDNGSPLIVIRTGEIFIEKFGKSPSFWVRQDGKIFNAVDFALIDKKRSLRIKEDISQQINKEQLSQIEIENTLNLKKNDFFKCYGQLIQKIPRASGQILISFTIENHGNTRKVEISKSEISDQNFMSCLQEVVARVQFRSFSGSPITTVFPLKFE